MNPKQKITADDYAAQVSKMVRTAHDWKNLHALETVKIQFNFPANVAICAAIPDALENRMVTANESGLSLIRAILLSVEGATVIMLKIALDMAFPPGTAVRGDG